MLYEIERLSQYLTTWQERVEVGPWSPFRSVCRMSSDHAMKLSTLTSNTRLLQTRLLEVFAGNFKSSY